MASTTGPTRRFRLASHPGELSGGRGCVADLGGAPADRIVGVFDGTTAKTLATGPAGARRVRATNPDALVAVGGEAHPIRGRSR